MPWIFCFIIPWNNNKKNNHGKLNMGFSTVPNLVPWLTFTVNILDVRVRIVIDQFCCIRLHFSFIYYARCQFLIWQGGNKGKRRWREGWGKGDYLWKAIVLNISVKGDDYSREAIHRWGTAIIRGNTVCDHDRCRYLVNEWKKEATIFAQNNMDQCFFRLFRVTLVYLVKVCSID